VNNLNFEMVLDPDRVIFVGLVHRQGRRDGDDGTRCPAWMNPTDRAVQVVVVYKTLQNYH
jgi:hypothetical protein